VCRVRVYDYVIFCLTASDVVRIGSYIDDTE